ARNWERDRSPGFPSDWLMPGKTFIHRSREHNLGGCAMATEGRVIFGKMDEVVFGRPAAEAVAEQTRRLGAERVFLMVSGTLNRETGEIASIRAALGNRCSGLFDKMPPHTP